MNKGNRKRSISRVLLLSGLFVLTAFLYAYAAENSGTNMQYSSNYYIDCAKTSFFKNIGPSFFSLLNNLIFSAIKALGSSIASIAGFALSTDLFQIIDELISPLFAAIHKYIFNGFSLTLIVVAGLYFIVLLAKQNMMGIISGIVSLIAVIALAGTFFLYPMEILTTANDVSVELSSSVLDIPYKSTGNGGELDTVKKAEVVVWDTLVHRPWQIIEFGDVETAEKYEKTILEMPCDTEERTDYVQQMYKDKGLFAPTSSYQLERISMGLLMLLFDLVIFVVLILFCVLIIGYQFFAILLALLGTFIFLMALLPRYGLKLLGNWAIKILSTMAVRVVLIFFLTIIFVVMGYVYALTGTYGVIPVLFLMVSIVVIIVLKRKELLGLFSGFDQPTGFVNKMLNADGNIIRHGVNQYQNIRSAGQRKEMREKREKREEVRDAINTETLENLSMRNEILRNKLATQENPEDRKMSEEELRQYRQNTDERRAEENNRKPKGEAPASAKEVQIQRGAATSAGSYTRQQREKGIELLRQSYEQSKAASEAEAQRTNQPVQYTAFVQRTDHLRAMNPNAEFDSRDVEKAARIVHNTEANGGSISVLRVGTEASAKEETPKKRTLVSNVPHAASENSSFSAPRSAEEGGEESLRRTSSKSLKGIAYFQANYGDEKGERFYNTMREKYGAAVSEFTSDEKLSPANVRRKLELESKQKKKEEK